MFEDNYSFSTTPDFNDLFFEESLLKYDFYKNDFFHERFMNNMQQMERLL